MQRPLTDSAQEPGQLPIQCPYCDSPFDISLRTQNGSSLPVKEAELRVLPYARDVEIFDPDPKKQGKLNSVWTTIGEDFFAGVNYERIGAGA